MYAFNGDRGEIGLHLRLSNFTCSVKLKLACVPVCMAVVSLLLMRL